jgi:diadenosine tetraphosphate (Ap4A) HIT family hydrolase
MKYLLSFLLLNAARLSASEHDCAFCRQSVVESQCIYENEELRIFADYAPRVKGHLLIVPKRHVAKAHELFREEWIALSDATSKTVKVFQKLFGTDQYIVLEKNGPLSFQTVPHVHFHLLPISEKMTQEKFLKIFYDRPEKLPPRELQEQVRLFRLSFAE